MEPLRELLFRATARYLTVRPDGLLLGSAPQPKATVRLLDHGGARTLYRGRKPHCRSLDGTTAFNGTLCNDCHERRHCTPQVRLDLLIEGRPYRLLLAHTSATNFLAYCARLRADHADPTEVRTTITVIDRESWGELHFDRCAE